MTAGNFGIIVHLNELVSNAEMIAEYQYPDYDSV